MKTFQIAVIGSTGWEDYPQGSFDFEKLYEISYRLGFLIAQNGFYTITGGKSGIMEWAAHGAKSAGGTTIGFIKWSERNQANHYTDIEIVTNMGDGGDAFLIPYSADAAVIVGGGVGTLKEIAGLYAQGKTLVAMRNTGGWSDRLADTFLDERQTVRIVGKDTPEEAIGFLLDALGVR